MEKVTDILPEQNKQEVLILKHNFQYLQFFVLFTMLSWYILLFKWVA
jgi:hypothetical protein